MERNCKAIIKKLSFPLDGCLNYDVQLWYECPFIAPGTYVHAGYGKYCRGLDAARLYAEEHATVPIEYQLDAEV